MPTPNIKITEDSEGIILYDCTGKYSSSNTNGHGIKNPEITDYVKSTLVIKSPNNLVTYNVVMTGDMPRTDDTGYLIRPSLVGGSIISGVWTFQLLNELSDGTVYKSNSYKKLLTREVDCCVDKLKNKIDIRLLTEGDEYQKKIVLLSASLRAAKWADKCQRFGDAQKIIEVVSAQCKCDCCF